MDPEIYADTVIPAVDEQAWQEYAEDAEADDEFPDWGYDDPAEYGDYEPSPYDGTYSED